MPLFVKAGAIIPMYPQMNYDGEKPLEPLPLDIYPEGKSSYQLYEDDGLTRDYQHNMFASTNISSTRNNNGTSVIIDAIKGTYKGMLIKRSYTLMVHNAKKPAMMLLNGQPSRNFNFDANDKSGVITINTIALPVNKAVTITIKY